MSEDLYAQRPDESYDDYLARITTEFREQVNSPEVAAYQAIRDLYLGLTQKGKFERTEALYVIGVYLATAAVMESAPQAEEEE